MKEVLGFLLIFFAFTYTIAQETNVELEQKPLNGDSLFLEAQKLAFGAEYAQSRVFCNQIIAETPEYWDVHTLIARTYAWEGKYDSSLQIIEATLMKNDSLDEMRYFEPTVLHWAGRNKDALALINLIEKQDSALNDELLFLRAKAKYAQYEIQPAFEDADSLVNRDTTNNESYIALRDELEKLLLFESLGLIYGFDFFQAQPDLHRHSLALEYRRRFSKNIFIGRITYANRFDQGDLQFEAEMYPVVGKRTYLYLHAAFSPTALFFPQGRLGIEPYVSLGKGFELSAGVRYLRYILRDSAEVKLNSDRLPATLFTASLGKYAGANYFNLRGYYGTRAFGNLGETRAAELLYRRYLGNPFNFLEAKVGVGNSPDDAYLESSFTQLTNNQSIYGVLGFQHMLNNRWFF